MTDYRPQIQQLARAHQYRLHPFALKRLSDFINEANTNDTDGRLLLRDLFTLLQKQTTVHRNGGGDGGQDRFVDVDRINSVIHLQVSKMQGVYQREAGPSVQVVGLKEVPRMYVDLVSEEVRVDYPENGLNGSSSSSSKGRDGGSGGQVGAWRQRYMLARRRCLRSGAYRKEIKSDRPVAEEVLPLIATSSLEGIPSHLRVAVLGLLVQRGERFLLEDLRGQVPLEFLVPPRGGEPAGVAPSLVDPDVFVGSGFLVVVKGTFENSVLRVYRVELPPAEKREALQKDTGSSDVFGLGPQDPIASRIVEKNAVQSVIVFLAHVHLDKPRTTQWLSAFFQRMQERSEEELTDTTFVLIGNFSSTPLHSGDVSHLPDVFDEADGLRVLLDQLAVTIASHSPTAAQHSHFILIPGPEDGTGLQGVWPQPPLPSDLLKHFRSRVRRVTLAPNPARLRFCTREIIISRREFLHDLQAADHALSTAIEASLHSKAKEADGAPPVPSDVVPFTRSTGVATTFERVTKTVVDEAHLAPDSRSPTRVLWPLDHVLHLPALPHTLLLCDSTEPWECFYKGTHVVNPGCFSVGASFLWHTPADGECNLSSVE